jgi:hypothetical protein
MPLEDFLVAAMPGHHGVSLAAGIQEHFDIDNVNGEVLNHSMWGTRLHTCGAVAYIHGGQSPEASPTSRHPRTNCADSTCGCSGTRSSLVSQRWGG